MLSDWIRRTGFWILDFVSGRGIIRKNYNDVKKRMSYMSPNLQQLDKLLKHAVTTTQFYKNYTPDNLHNFPIINKNIIKLHWDELHSEVFRKSPKHYMSTSGSTGTPFTMEWDIGKRKRQLADLIYFNELAGQKLGQPYIYFRVWTDKNKKSKLEQWVQNITPINILHLDDETLEQIRIRLKRKPYINSCLAYASTYEFLVHYLTKRGDTPDMFNIKSFISGSEVLTMEIKRTIKERIGCMVIDRYSNQENGFLAQSGDLSDEFKVNIASFCIEILKEDSDEPVKVGEVGRIIVTDLYNYAVPLIRYDTGDLAIKASECNGWTTELKTIQGRQVDVIFDTKGRRLTSHVWGVYMWRFNKLKQYQFIQEGAKQYVIKLNGAKGIYSDTELIEYLKNILGADSEIQIEHVDGIPTLASGKFKRTICNYVYDEKNYS